MGSLTEIANKSIADYGFRQVALWSPGDVISRWGLSPREAEVLEGVLHQALEALPVPVEPRDIPAEQDRLSRLISEALAG